MDKIFETNFIFRVYRALRESSISIFQESFASIGKIFILVGRLNSRLWFYEVLRFS